MMQGRPASRLAKNETAAKVAEWEAKRETSQLQTRADRAERYAAASIVVWQPSMMRSRQRLKLGSRGKMRILFRPKDKRQTPLLS